jgi:hypothetical protein
MKPLVDCAAEGRVNWSDIDNAFSKPTKASDVKSVYAPTQIISEFIKSKGYDGTAYKSALAKRT